MSTVLPFSRFLGSMSLAILLLSAVAIASVIGTLLQQNQPHLDYIVKFGSFWYEIYSVLGLYDVYSCLWFLSLITFLVLSTGVCLTRHSPNVLRQIRDFRQSLGESSLRSFHNHAEFTLDGSIQEQQVRMQTLLKSQGYRTRLSDGRVDALRGSGNRIGYIFIHLSIIVICVGGLLDSNVLLKLRLISGDLQVEERNLPASEVPARSRLNTDNSAFRSAVLIPEGKGTGHSFINIDNGYLLQELPFTVYLDDFAIEHYPNGQPRSFTSSLVIRDKDGGAPKRHSASVNHPVKHRSYTLFQSSFDDGGSVLELRVQPIAANTTETELITLAVGQSMPLRTSAGEYQLELVDFRKFNIFPVEGELGETTAKESSAFRDHGPSMQYILRAEDGVAREYLNYMLPVERDGRHYLLSGMRSNLNEEFRYLYIPMDQNFTGEEYFLFQRALFDDAFLKTTIGQFLDDSNWSTKFAQFSNEELDLNDALLRFITAFRNQGMDSIRSFMEDTLPPDQRESALRAYGNLLQSIMFFIYQRALSDASREADPETFNAFFTDSLTAFSSLSEYGAPVYLQLLDYEHIEASGLQITRTPGAKWVYLGFALLLSGVFLMFYVSHQHVHVLLRSESGRILALFAGQRTRKDPTGFQLHFNELRQAMEGHPPKP